MRRSARFLYLVILTMVGCSQNSVSPGLGDPCSASWLQAVESRVVTGDGHGHGPDIGSQEWRSVVEFKLGVRDNPAIPPRDRKEWCNYIDELIVDHAI